MKLSAEIKTIIPKHWTKWKSEEEKNLVIDKWKRRIKSYKLEIKNTEILIKKLYALEVEKQCLKTFGKGGK
jgi:hypothetical protein